MMRKRLRISNKLVNQLFFGLLLTTVSIFILMTALVYLTSVDTGEKFYKEKMENIANLYVSTYETTFRNMNDKKLSFQIASDIVDRFDAVRLIRLWSENGLERFVFPEENSDFISVQGNNDYFQIFKKANITYAHVVKSFKISSSDEHFFVEIFSPVDDVQKITIDALWKTFVLVVMVIIFFVPLWFMLLQKILGPIHQMALDIKNIKSMPPAAWKQLQQIPDNDFLNEIITSVNELIFRSQRSLVCQENLGRFLSHEIKAPLTNLMNEIEIIHNKIPRDSADKNVCQQAVWDVIRLRSIVNNICDLAYIDSELHLEETVELKDLVETLIVEFEHIYKAKIILKNDLIPATSVRLNADYFWILFSNILRNSIDHGNGLKSPPVVRLSQEGSRIRVEFIDQGPGFPFPKEILEKINSEEGMELLLRAHCTGLVLCLKLSEVMSISIHFENLKTEGAMVVLLFEP